MSLHAYCGKNSALLERNSFRSTKLLSVIDWVVRQSDSMSYESVSAAVSEGGEASTNKRLPEPL